MATKSWQDVFTEQAKAEARATGRSVDEVADEYWETMEAQFTEAGLDIEEVLNDERWQQPYEPVSIMIDRIVKERDERQDNELAARSLSNQEYLAQEERVIGQAQGKVARALAPIAEAVLPQQTDRYQTTRPPTIEAPVSLDAPESRFDMQQRLGRTLTQDEYEKLRSEKLGETWTDTVLVDGRPIDDYLEDPKPSESRKRLIDRTFKAASAIQDRRQGIIDAYKNHSMAATRAGLVIPEPVDMPDPLPETASDEEKWARTQELLEIPDVRREVQDLVEQEAEQATGGFFGVLARPMFAAAGAVGGTGPLLARAAEVGVLQPTLAATSTIARWVGADDLAEDQERIWYENERRVATGTHWMHDEKIRPASTETMFDAWAQNDKLIESRLKDKQFWKSARADFADNVAGLGHLVATFMPTSLDILRELERKELQPEGFVSSAKYAFDAGFMLPAGMAGAILSMLASPKDALAAQPISAAMTLWPMFKLLKAAKVKGAAVMLDKLDDIARRAGIDLNDPKFQKLTIPENLANRFINEARRGARTRWGKIVESKFGETVFTQDYIKAVRQAVETPAQRRARNQRARDADGETRDVDGEARDVDADQAPDEYKRPKFLDDVDESIKGERPFRDTMDRLDAEAESLRGMPRLPDVEFRPGLTRTAKAGAAAYILSQEDPEDTLTALAMVGGANALWWGLNKWDKTKVPMQKMKAWTGRLAANIAMMADPELTAKVETMVDRILEGRNLVESDFKTIQQAVGSAKGRLILEQLVPDLAEIKATRDALLGKVEALPDVKKAKAAYDEVAAIYDDMKANKVGEAELRAYADDVVLPARAAYRELRVRRFAENWESSNLRLPSEETGALVLLNRLMEKRSDLTTRLNERLAKVDSDEAAALARIDDQTSVEALAKLEDDLTKAELNRVGVRTKNLAKNQIEHLEALKKLEDAVKNKSGKEYAAAVAEYEARVKAAADKFDKRVASGRTTEVGKTKFETELIEETRQAEVALFDDLDAIADARANDIGALETARQTLLDNIQRKRFAAAQRASRGVKGLKEEGAARVQTRVEMRRQTRESVKRKYTNERRRLKRQEKLDQETNNRSIEEQSKVIEMHNTRAMESSFLGDLPDEGVHVYNLDAPVRFDVSRAGQEGANRFDYLDTEGQPTTRYYDQGEAPQGAPSGLFPDTAPATPAKLDGAYLLESIGNLSQAEASNALRAITRIAENLAEHDLGFAGIVNSLDQAMVPGALGGKNLAKRIYIQILNDILFEERSAALLRSPDLRNQFTRHLYEKVGDALALPGDAKMTPAIRKKLEVGIGKLVNDFTFGRTRGTKYLNVNPVFELADGQLVGMKRLFDDYMSGLGKRQEGVVKRARAEALDTFRQQMIGRMEEGIAAKWFWEQVGSTGWFDDGISPRYFADIADYFAREGHMPPILKSSPEQIQSMLRLVDEDGVARLDKAVSDLANRLIKRDPDLQMDAAITQASNIIKQVQMRLSRTSPEGTEAFVQMKGDVLPSLKDTGAPHEAVLDQGAGIVRWKAPVRVEDMAGWTQMMGKLENAYINKEIGGAANSTLGWLFMANRVMNQGGMLHGMRQLSSAIKRNLTTQRPQTALTNFMSNYLAMMTREGLLPQQAALEIINTANLWKRFSKDPTTLTAVERGRVKGLFDRGITSNNAVSVDANIVMDAFSNNPLNKAIDLYATGPRKLKGVGDVMRAMDWAYQAGDGIFKLNDSLRALQRLDGYTNNLNRGNSITFMDVSRRNKVMGKVTREMNGDLVVEYKGKRHTGKAAEKALEDIKLDTATGYANSLYFDYSRVPGFIELARNFDAMLFGPFKTWAWKSLDIPGLKRGMGTRAIFGDTMIRSTDGHVMAQVYGKRSVEGMRRAAILGLTRASTRDDEYLRRLVPEWIAPTAFFDDKRMTFQSMGNRNFAINMSNILDAAWKLTRPEHEDVIMRKLRPKEKTATEELGKLVLGDGLVVGTLMNAIAGKDDRDQPIPSWEEWIQYFGQKATPGWIYAGGDSLATLIDGMRPLSGIRKANRWRDDKTRMTIGAYLLKVWTGRRLENIDPMESLKVLANLSGYTVTGIDKGTPKIKKLANNSSTLVNYYNRKYKDDMRDWKSEHPNADKELLRNRQTERRKYWNDQRDKLQSVYLELAKDIRDAMIRQNKASIEFKKIMKRAKLGRSKDLIELETALDAQSGAVMDMDMDAAQLPIPGVSNE